jgi:hypothetical protein
MDPRCLWEQVGGDEGETGELQTEGDTSASQRQDRILRTRNNGGPEKKSGRCKPRVSVAHVRKVMSFHAIKYSASLPCMTHYTSC